MDQIHLYAYESMGQWTLSMNVSTVTDDGQYRWSDLYRGTHVGIDEQDPLVRAVLLLHQVYSDCNQAIRGDLDILAERPAHH